MSKHTPGPWEYRECSGCVEAVGNTQMLICAAPRPSHEDCPANEAFFNGNARLIAAAPDLLAALTELVETFHKEARRCSEGYTAAARAAIAKATGQS